MPGMTDRPDVIAARERLRRMADGVPGTVVYEFVPVMLPAGGSMWPHEAIVKYEQDRQTIEADYLAEHDPTPIASEWLEAVGFEYNPKSALFFRRRVMIGMCDKRSCVWIGSMVSGGGLPISTRGQVRLLCRALGIELPENR